ncbi:ATP-binding protein [Pseudanabaena sp. PCC 6802]|uniref:ATP-binding protein n=1 Tax=Pseudanabaena sp. PCC 6802 TaxID=118173 RepID=UPI00034D6883|nr:ATP-binding protein [Pseudanabaena sp. PCC 6802]
MSDIDRLFQQNDKIFERWNLREIPFTESASSLRSQTLDRVFTGRVEELKQVVPLLRGRERKRVLVYGWTGIGKSAFILEVLQGLQRNDSQAKVAYITLQPNMDLGTAALIALAREMPEDEWAQRQLNEMGLGNLIRQRDSEIGGQLGISAKFTEKILDVEPTKYPALAFEGLLERALKTSDRVAIGIDDLDKQDPARVRQLLEDAQGMLKGDAWFFLSGHPGGLTRDLVNRERGLFDLSLELNPFDVDTTYTMLKKYLASARIKDISDNDEVAALHPFTPETARILCEKSSGIPRWFNRSASYILLRAANLEADKITLDILEAGLEYAKVQLRGQTGFTAEEAYLLQLILGKGILSDENITLGELERMGVKEFNEILPMINALVQQDLVRLLPDDRAIAIAPNPILQAE